MRIMALALTSVGCMAWTAVAGLAQGVEAQPPRYLASYYTTAPAPKQVTITSQVGGVLSVLEVPAEVALSIHLASGESNTPDDKTANVTFTGDVSIRTRPRSEIVPGPLLNQMMSAPFRLDVHDAIVVVALKR